MCAGVHVVVYGLRGIENKKKKGGGGMKANITLTKPHVDAIQAKHGKLLCKWWSSKSILRIRVDVQNCVYWGTEMSRGTAEKLEHVPCVCLCVFECMCECDVLLFSRNG